MDLEGKRQGRVFAPDHRTSNEERVRRKTMVNRRNMRENGGIQTSDRVTGETQWGMTQRVNTSRARE